MKEKSKPLSFFAGIVDFYYIALILGFLLAFYVTIIGKNPMNNIIYNLLILIFNIAIVMIYHLYIANKTNFLSIGERIAGRIINDNKKYFHNPYKINRFGLFFVIIFTLIILGNSWDKVFEGRLIAQNEAALTTVIIVLFTYGYLKISDGKLYGLFFIISIYLYYCMILFKYINQSQTHKIIFYFCGICAVIFFIIWLLYYIKTKERYLRN